MSELENSKVCSKCKELKPLNKFTRDKYKDKVGKPPAYTSNCNSCRSKLHKEWAIENPERVKFLNDKNKEKRKQYYDCPKRKLKYRNSWLLRTYGIDNEQYNILSESQGNVCAICNKEEPQEKNNYLAVDHCHKTGIIRGLLCSNCNRAIGLLNDSVEFLKNAINYLEKHHND